MKKKKGMKSLKGMVANDQHFRDPFLGAETLSLVCLQPLQEQGQLQSS